MPPEQLLTLSLLEEKLKCQQHEESQKQSTVNFTTPRKNSENNVI